MCPRTVCVDGEKIQENLMRVGKLGSKEVWKDGSRKVKRLTRKKLILYPLHLTGFPVNSKTQESGARIKL